jgi:hypothetical protein
MTVAVRSWMTPGFEGLDQSIYHRQREESSYDLAVMVGKAALQIDASNLQTNH